jgi:hypothetical protein
MNPRPKTTVPLVCGGSSFFVRETDLLDCSASLTRLCLALPADLTDALTFSISLASGDLLEAFFSVLSWVQDAVLARLWAEPAHTAQREPNSKNIPTVVFFSMR